MSAVEIDDYAARNQRKETERHAWANAFMAALGGTVLEPHEHHAPCHYLTGELDGIPFGISFNGRYNGKPDQVGIGPDWPYSKRREHMRPYNPKTTHINIGMAKAPKVAAADFKRRFWAVYVPEYREQLEKKETADNSNNDAKALAVQLAKVIGDWRIGERIEAQDSRDSINLYGQSHANWDVRRYGSVRLTLDISNNPAAVLAIAAFIEKTLPKEKE